jgi:hypothetical protein
MREQWQTMAETAIETYEVSGESFAALAGEEMDREAERPVVKDAAIRRLMQTTNDLTDKPHSASSAEKIVECDLEYASFLHASREIVVQKNHAFTRMQAAKLRAEMAIALLRSHDGAGVTS